MKAGPFVPVQFDNFALSGGLDLVTPTTALKPGVARDAVNFEVSVTGGYSRIRGYERYDGRVGNPSDATFSAVTVNTTAGIAAGDAISNGTGGTGKVILIAGSTIYYTLQVGAIAVADVLNGTATVTAVGFDLSQQARKEYTGLAADVYRALIGVVPGSGPVRGVETLGSTLYAWRNNAGGSALELYKSTTSGWSKVDFPYELSFTSGGATAITDGASIANGAGATGTVARVVIENGSVWSGTASGRLILSASAGTWASGNNIQVGGVTRATVTPPSGTTLYTAAARLTCAPSGRVQTVKGNFGGAQATKIYGCDNVNRGFEFDGTTFVPIRTGMAADTPTNVAVHKNSLYFSFGASLQNSGLATPYTWTVITGAAELVVDSAITALLPLPGDETAGALGVFTATKTYVLYVGASTTLSSYNTGVGAGAYTAQNLEQPYFLAERGITTLSATQHYGNFDTATLTPQLRPYLAAKRGTATASGVNRERSQYRVFYADGSGVYLTLVNGQFRGAMPVQFPHTVRCYCEGFTGQTTEAAFFGDDDGYVRRMDVGTSFDGTAIESRLLLNFDHMGNPRVLKRFRKAALELAADDYTQFRVGYSLAYADSMRTDQASAADYVNPFSTPQWDTFSWDAAEWDGITLGPTEIEVVGSGENIAMSVESSTNVYDPFTINSITIHYTPRRGLR